VDLEQRLLAMGIYLLIGVVYALLNLPKALASLRVQITAALTEKEKDWLLNVWLPRFMYVAWTLLWPLLAVSDGLWWAYRRIRGR
jgi:hypothetical protein